jgi:hypothetical protein
MSPEEIQTFSEALIDACDKHQLKGGKIVAGRFQDPSCNGKCPIVCLIGEHWGTGVGGLLIRPSKEWLSEILGFTVETVEWYSVVHGVDNSPKENDIPELYEVGKRLRSHYNL